MRPSAASRVSWNESEGWQESVTATSSWRRPETSWRPHARPVQPRPARPVASAAANAARPNPRPKARAEPEPVPGIPRYIPPRPRPGPAPVRPRAAVTHQFYVDELWETAHEPSEHDRQVFLKELPFESYTTDQLEEWIGAFGNVESFDFLVDNDGLVWFGLVWLVGGLVWFGLVCWLVGLVGWLVD